MAIVILNLNLSTDIFSSTGATIPANTKHGPRFEVFKNGTFVIKNIQLQDRGQYLCTAQNRFGSDRMVITLAVQTQAPKIQPPKSTELAAYLGKSVTLDCFALGKPPAQISWILPDRTFVRQVGTVHTVFSPVSLLQNGTLQILSPSFSSKGDYKCIASNAAGADTITYHVHVAALPPSISEGSMDTVIIQPGSVQKLKVLQTENMTKLPITLIFLIIWLTDKYNEIIVTSQVILTNRITFFQAEVCTSTAL